MNHQQIAFRRKIIYIIAICLLVTPLFMLGQPATRAKDGESSAGGVLAQLRSENDLAQSNLSEIDPASETMKLATLGFRGIAANILWDQANDYKMKKNWDKLSVTLNQIIKIQPNFLSVWEFQAHNLSYNVSVEFDDYQYRYHWVKKGIYFLMSGIAYNKRDHRILSNLGFFFGQKLGKSDEQVQFRRMFRKDRDFHTDLSEYVEIDQTQGPGGPDNWLVSHQWYLLAETLVDEDPDVKVGGKAELMFYKEAPSMLRNFANALEEEFEPDERARRAWQAAHEAWLEFGRRQIRTSAGTLLVLREEDRVDARIEELRDELDELLPGARDQLRAEKLSTLEPEELTAYNIATLSPEELAEIDNDPSLTPDEKRYEKRRRIKLADWGMSFEQLEYANSARMKMQISDMDVVTMIEEIAPDNSEQAYRLFLEIADNIERLQWISNYQTQVNYRYWETRALAESQPTAITARSAMYHARRLENETILDEFALIDPDTGLQIIDPETGQPATSPGAKQMYEEAYKHWREIYRTYPDLVDDVASGIMMASIVRYHQVLMDIGDEWPLDFPLQFIVDRFATGYDSPIPTSDELEVRRMIQEGIDPPTNDSDDSGSGDTGDENTTPDDDAADDDTADDDTADDDTADDDTADDDTADDDTADDDTTTDDADDDQSDE